MLQFAVETCAPPQTTSILATRVAERARAAEQVSEPGVEVRLRGPVARPAEETGFYLDHAASPDAVRAAIARGPPARPADQPIPGAGLWESPIARTPIAVHADSRCRTHLTPLPTPENQTQQSVRGTATTRAPA